MKVGHHYRSNAWVGLYKNPDMNSSEIMFYDCLFDKPIMYFVVERLEQPDHTYYTSVLKVLASNGIMGWIFLEKNKENEMRMYGNWTHPTDHRYYIKEVTNANEEGEDKP